MASISPTTGGQVSGNALPDIDHMLNLVFSTTGFPSELLTIDTCITSADASDSLRRLYKSLSRTQ